MDLSRSAMAIGKKKQNNKQHKYTAANIHVELLLFARTLRGVDR